MTEPHGPESTNGGGPRAESHDEPPASVAAEAALLVELLTQRGAFSTGGTGAGPHPSAGADAGAGAGANAGSGARPEQGECVCGGTTPAACRVCPLCQVIAFVQRINPDTIERIADFAAFAATALRDVAAAQRTAPEQGQDAAGDDAAGDDAADADAADAADVHPGGPSASTEGRP